MKDLNKALRSKAVVIKESSAATHIYASKERQQVSKTFLLSRPRRLMVKKMAALHRASIDGAA
jgi:hypothetical protein